MSESSFLNPQAAVAAMHISPGSRVADLAAGSGFFARAAARATGPQGLVWAVDAHQDMLPRLKNLAVGEGLHNIEVVRGTLEKLGGTKLPDATMDVALLANALFSIEDKHAAAAEVARVLRKAGRLLLIDWTDSHGGLGPHPDHIVRASEAKKIFEATGFTQAEDIPAGEYHWGLILRKK
ncbi:MAG TPA: methyltransferase domain-containing protein [Candidatus Paceibacterota bacterium]|jgi:ubiquinone/menaquinone biosynthesis C-methylase UbiE|nr:methyltransferase domain-containing protein [Candidatus Paceibacterota bacterium]